MKKTLKNKLILELLEHVGRDDPSHDYHHALRIMHLCEKIGRKEKADLDVLIPAALFHDAVCYPKNSPESALSADHSADLAQKTLKEQKYSEEKINAVETCIRECSFSKGTKPSSLESMILQDADRLEATGAISIMRTYSSSGQMKRQFYDPADPFRKKTNPNHGASLDLFFRRLLKVGDMMNTATGRKMAKRRTEFLKKFLRELELELKESGVKTK